MQIFLEQFRLQKHYWQREHCWALFYLFMMGVTTLSLPSMIMLRKAVKPKLLWILLQSVLSELYWLAISLTPFSHY